MIQLKQEIEEFLNSNWANTNDKEQNMQGRLYAWLLRLEQRGYTVEMETSIHDEHLADIMPDLKDNKPSKTEMDIFIHDASFIELYAIELKWIYNKTTGWNVVDHLEDFEDDAKFCNWLADKADFTETCSVVVYDFEESKQVKRFSPKERKEDKYKFLGEDYPCKKDRGKIFAGDEGQYAPFTWHKLNNQPRPNRDYYYYIISFQNKNSLATKVMLALEQIYSYRWNKLAAMVMESSWWDWIKTDHVVQANEEEIIASICREIDNGKIK